MRFSVCVMADVDEIGFFSHAEALGYDSVWVTDSQMLFSDCYAVLALAARQTRRIRLGPGVAICGTRIPPVHVAAMATLNRLAPGRVHLGVGTGNTATRSMGRPPMRIAEYAEHLRVMRGLLSGEPVDYARDGSTRPIKMLIREKKYMSLEPRIPLYVSGFGPRAMELAGEFGDGLVFAIPPRGVPPAEALALARGGAARRAAAWRTSTPPPSPTWSCSSRASRRTPSGSSTRWGRTSWRVSTTSTTRCTSGVSSRRHSCAASGPATASSSRRLPRAHRHFRTHEGHYTYLHPGEAELIDAELIRATCLVGEADELIERIRELERGGLRELMFATGVDEKWRFSEEFARRVVARY